MFIYLLTFLSGLISSITEPSILEANLRYPTWWNVMQTVQGDNNLYARWSWTWNNPERDPEEWLDVLSDLLAASRGIFQLEAGDSGTQHFQGYLEFASSGRKRFAWLKKHVFTSGQHFNKSRKPPLANWRYCSKEETRISGPWFFGTVPTVPKWAISGDEVSDSTLVALVRGAAGPKEIVAAVRENRELAHAVHAIKLSSHFREARTWQTQCLVLHSPGGIGKSMPAKAIADHVGSNHGWQTYYKCLTKWWDGYCGQEIVIFDDFKPLSCASTSSNESLTQYRRIDCEQWRSRINQSTTDCRTFRPRRPSSAAYKTVYWTT